ncbi:MAG TPA: nitroreductase family protein [Acetobacteraceae bacterium]|jgi:nitroreductase/FMN reductase [NAD(P)H]|nr:nitroreductase family protein [Acetobacteraceae bacterium]
MASVDSTELLHARYGLDQQAAPVPPAVAALLDRRVTRRYRDEDIPDPLLDALLAAAQSAPTKSDLQQYSVVVMRDRERIKRIADWIGTMDWIATAPVFLVWCGDMRRGQRLCDLYGMPHANNNLDTFLNTAVDCTLAMGQFIVAADAAGLGTCPISYVRSHIEKVTPLLGLPTGVYPVAGLTVGWPVFRRPIAMRLPPSVVVHRERYDDSALEHQARAYDARRGAREPIAAGSLKNNDVYPPRDGVGWSENAARQLSVPERFGFAAYLKTRGFELA